MALTSLRNLYLTELRDIYDAEERLLQHLPLLAEASFLPELREAFNTHLAQTKMQAERLQQIFEKLGADPSGNPCKTMSGLIAECADVMTQEKSADPGVFDAALIGAAQKIEHLEIASYGCARTYAELLGEEDAAKLLQVSLEEEGETDRLLTRIAMRVNLEAAQATEKGSPGAAPPEPPPQPPSIIGELAQVRENE
ncbi:MAG: ferritin-like domain-containing protein [Verrucomicrobiota bacterium]|nr:ferritin-like domain-containing protein [Verrucomicrobiota bacterium]